MDFTRAAVDAPAVHVLHDNAEWLPVFERAFAEAGVPLRAWHWNDLVLGLDAEPPIGVFWSRLSASAHTRGAPNAREIADAVFAWLGSWDRRIVGGPAVAALEVSKAAQHAALRRFGFDVPRTTAVRDPRELAEIAAGLRGPFIVKGNRGGKGLGVALVEDAAALAARVEASAFEESPDGITLIQEYLPSRDGSITRAEFIGGRFVYAVRVDVSAGFELCPAEACRVPGGGGSPLFGVRDDIDASDPLITAYESFLDDRGIEIAGIEFVETPDGRRVTYDVNTNTNYSPDVEAAVEHPAARRVAEYFGELLAALPRRAAREAGGGAHVPRA